MSATAIPRRTGIANLPLHYGKDGIPYPVDRKTYDQSIELLNKAIHKTKLGIRDKKEAINMLSRVGIR